MWNMAVNNISYSIYLLLKIEKGYTTKIIPFFFCSVYKYAKVELSLNIGFWCGINIVEIFIIKST